MVIHHLHSTTRLTQQQPASSFGFSQGLLLDLVQDFAHVLLLLLSC